MRAFAIAVTAATSLGAGIGVAAVIPPASATTVRAVTIVSASKSAVLGDRVAVTVKVASPTRARSVQLQTLTKDIYGNSSWSRISTQQVSGTARHTFRPVLNQANRERFRAVATYKTGKRVASKPVGVAVWSWTPLAKLPAYYTTNGVNSYEYSNFGMAGNQYLGWFTYGSYGMWEARYTSGRHCKALRGDFGVNDKSADGATVQLDIVNVDSGELLYRSPTLSPGMVAKATVALPSPYRISIRARNTSADGVLGYPAIGDPQLLCTGLTS